MIDVGSMALSGGFAAFGKPAVYRPAAGVEIPCTVIPASPDARWSGYSTGTNTASYLADLRVSEVPDAQKGGYIDFGGRSYRVTNVTTPDPDRLLQRLELAPC